MNFEALKVSFAVIDLLESVERTVRTKRKSLADQIGRAAESIALNLAEGRERAGLDQRDLYRRAAGSAGELTAALHIARARRYISPDDHAAVEASLDRLRGLLWGLTH